MSQTETKRISKGYEPIPGYVLEEVLGRGGFGEVWRANAPGGLKKAVKFVFGTQDEARGSRELRSLERIKGVCHPFLLTLERFEVIDNQLVIVTELADCSLEDVYKQNRDRGSCGIARDVLLSHLHDAADALDYLHQRYQLQHLDVKPGNLLLVGGHVKVADFGLLKDLREIECSIVGGLTPIYAPPEVFDGRPSMHSDQYSLAVMYQELLTGTRPFGGRTIAQLATQHVHSAPNLDPLPPSDRPLVAKAMEKNPERRFANCKAFVDALKAPRGKETTVTSFGEDFGSDDTKRVAATMNSPAAVDDLPQLGDQAKVNSNSPARDDGEKAIERQQAVVIALGGTGADCLREMRRRAADPQLCCPFDLHSVLIDTDIDTIHSLRKAETCDRVSKCNLIHTPLRTAHEYRQEGTDRLKTISRRWIYNVPRSLSTEGMRTLGRLALVDHGPIVLRRLKKTIDAIASVANESTPSVYVVGSLTGGTGSGMYIDVVYLVRHLLDQVGLEEVEILSMLANTALETNPAEPLALHDAQAALIEMHYFLQAGNGYPGDTGAQWPSVPAARTPLRKVYMVADGVRGTSGPPPIDTIVDYIWSDANGGGDLLAAARKLTLKENSTVVPPSLRSVGVVPLANLRETRQKPLIPFVVRESLVRWLGLPSKARRTAIPLADRLMRRAGIAADTIIAGIDNTLLTDTSRDSFDAAMANLSPEDAAAAAQSIIESKMEQTEFQKIPTNVINSVYRELTVALSDRRADLTTAIECLRIITAKTVDLEACCQIGLRLAGHDKVADSDASVSIGHVQARLIAAHYFRQISSSLHSLQERLEDFATVLAIAIVESSKSQPEGRNPWESLPEVIRSQFNSVELALHETTVNQYLVRSLSSRGSEIDAKEMVAGMNDAVVPIVSSLFDENQDALLNQSQQEDKSTMESLNSNSMNLFDGSGFSSDTITQQFQSLRARGNSDEPLSVEDAIDAVKPALLEFGGLQRLILIVGHELERGHLEPQIRALHKGSLTVAIIPGARAKLIHEAQQIELNHILSRLSILNGGNSQVTSRLASRTDISW